MQITSQLSLLDTAKEGKINKRQQQILDLFENLKLQMISDDIVSLNNRQISRFLDLEINIITPRVNELVKMGKLVEHKKMKDNITNRLVIYWRLA